ncbi:MAG: DNA mismatch repair protein [Chitinophagaceae bacterium]|nr:DNA mismatch repair protein [Chitinophagaceae bacterium]
MNFYTDRQTIDDLNIFGKRGKQSVYVLFNRTYTKGGAELLEHMFRHPLADITAINERIQCIRLFAERPWDFFQHHDLFDILSLYLSMRDTRSRLLHTDNGLTRTLNNIVKPDTDLQMIKKGIQAGARFLQELKAFSDRLETDLSATHPWKKSQAGIRHLLQHPDLQLVLQVSHKQIPFEKQVVIDQLLRFRFNDEMQKLLNYCFEMDVYMSVGKLAAIKDFVFPEPVTIPKNLLELKGVYHPELEKPIANDLRLDEEQNLLFLTGANMAGKSTFMKSVGIALYLAHMGFPVPAASMRFSVRDGLLTTINLSDNLNMGFSHFYSEARRVKLMAAALKKGLNMFLLIDELFRGTNVKDAHDGTIAISAGFAKKRNSCYIISTHIMEAGEQLARNYPQISFYFLPTRMEGHMPVYPRILEKGISADRHGMVIIHNEGIIEMLNAAAKKIQSPQKNDHAVPC